MNNSPRLAVPSTRYRPGAAIFGDASLVCVGTIASVALSGRPKDYTLGGTLGLGGIHLVRRQKGVPGHEPSRIAGTSR
jgi:hypothetical protein